MVNSVWFRIKIVRVSSLIIYCYGKEGMVVEIFVESDDLVFVFIVFV